MPTYVLNHNHSSNIHASMRVDASHAFLAISLRHRYCGLHFMSWQHCFLLYFGCNIPRFYLMEFSLSVSWSRPSSAGALSSSDPAPSCSCSCPSKTGGWNADPYRKDYCAFLSHLGVRWVPPQAHICSIFLKFMSKKRSTECCLQP